MYYKALAHMIVEAKKSHGLPFASWRLVSRRLVVSFGGLRARGPMVIPVRV